ncbi:MAG TPA: c-type cytochrome [Candidatus Acidoferrales bacterium]|nr:c-type cytochrome [Candidatus Acidoferrales bacterium]
MRTGAGTRIPRIALATIGIGVLISYFEAGAQSTRFHKAPIESAGWRNPFSKKEGAAKAGAALFAQNCAPCHGTRAEGSGNVPDLRRGATHAAPDGEIYWYITHGDPRNGMPGWPNLSRDDRWRIVTFLKTLSPGTPPAPAAGGMSPAMEAAMRAWPAPRPPFTDFRYEHPGAIRRITVADLPPPYATRSAGNGPQIVARPENEWPQVPAGFSVELYATGLDNPRLTRTAPNGDVFVAESEPGDIKVVRGFTPSGKPERVETFAAGMRLPYGINFYPPGPDPQYVYIGTTDAVLRFPYRNGDMKARGPAERIASLPGGGNHWTRDIAFTPDGKKMLVSVGSASNVDDPDTTPAEHDRADILEFNPDGTGMRVYASGLRNAGSGIAFDPKTGELWCSVNERDGLGDDLAPDYITHVVPGGFYGWPWYYIGGHPDPRHRRKHPELKDKVIVPDVLLQPHNASLEFTFYEGKQFPAEYRGDIFASQHGSWNRSVRTGYEVIRIPLHQTGRATGEYEEFVTGFVLPDGSVWGRPVGIAVASDGSLLVTDDASGSIWRIRYTKK